MPKKLKPVHYELIAPGSDAGARMYPLLALLVEEFHLELKDARIGLAWCTSWKPDADGRWILGKCKRASDLDRELAAFDFIILLNREFWSAAEVTDHARQALLDHELHHAAIKLDTNGEKVVDERGRLVYRTRKHDLEEFAAIAERYGCWKRDLEMFAAALAKGHQHSGIYIGFTRLQQRLAAMGYQVAIDEIVHWSEKQRHEASAWVVVAEEMKRAAIGDTRIEVAMPQWLGRIVLNPTP